jgi:predicted anti-sigma-YlaC factor YlaD
LIWRSGAIRLTSCMNCFTFEEKLSDYFDGLLAGPDVSLFREHALQCRGCRSLMDDVKSTIQICKTEEVLDTTAALETALMAISIEHAVMDCDGFEALMTEFLDGFVPAPTYHRFEEHAEVCNECSTLLSEVVYAVAACHSVHTFEEVDVPASLVANLLSLMRSRKPSLARRFADRVGVIASHLIPNPARTARWTFATSVTLAIAMLAFLFLGFSDDGTLAGIYRQANVKASELYSHGADVYVETDKAVARLESVGYRIGEVWDTLGGENEPDGRVKQLPGPEPNSNRRAEPSETN